MGRRRETNVELPISMTDWLLATGIVLVGAIIQGAIGFGVALVGAPLLYLIDPVFVPAPVIMIGMTLPAMILARDWHSVDFRDVAWVLPGMAGGSVIAGWILGVLTARMLGLVFGVLVLVAVAISAVGRMPRPGRGGLAVAGTAAGFMATTTSIGGPPLALAFQHVRGPRLRGTLSACFLPGGVFSLLALSWADQLGPTEWLIGLSLLPAITAGFLLSGRLTRYLDRGWLRPALLIVSAAAGAAAVVRAVLGTG